MWLAAAFAALSFAGALLYYWLDRREAPRGTLALAPAPERFDWRHMLTFRTEYWLLVAICVTFYSVIFPFRSTFAIKYLQEAQGLTLDKASTLNSYVFLAAVLRDSRLRSAAGSAGSQYRAAGAGLGAPAAELSRARRHERRGRRDVDRAARG